MDDVTFLSPASSTALVATLRQFAPAVRWLGSGWLQRKVFDWIPSNDVRRLARIVDILDGKSREIFEAKKKAAKEKGSVGEGKDIMSILRK